ncbi:glycosyltransferase family 39 protein [Carboxylicivirga sp. A043]|uniref:glycosyltransferase family 39 protein n=1 Tax=Carboxylicivirga litoralis TaxID=2816963 RepID=UPI0021CB26F6|nr:glycosyltransferase family 39 protein [Carboxylicivirga sp. A043]MCU4155960.1 glycosyltransferase family 39 protein [Carboxylicivirga sp. A043]
MPTSVHAWAQSDHYALALGFLDNGFDFFHPQTYALSHQFPPAKDLKVAAGITAVDFPVLHYVVAVFMKVTGDTSPWIFRLISLMVSFISLLFVFRVINKVKGFWLALIAVGFVMFQPIYVYYQNGFHVSSAAFNVQLVGIACMLNYRHFKVQKAFYWGIVFLTLAALMRFTQIITLIAIFWAVLVQAYQERKFDKRLFLIGCGLLLVGAYFVYNKYLSYLYGSVFLGSPLPADSISDLLVQLFRIGKSYLRGFLPFMHLLGFIIVISLYLKQKGRDIKVDEWNLWLLFSFLGTTMFTLIMSWSLSAHDYYSLDTWLAPLVLAFIYCLCSLNLEEYKTGIVGVVAGLFLVGTFSVALEHQVRKYDDKVEIRGADLTIKNFTESATFLNSLIPNDAKVLIITGTGWNTPMMGWQRPAYRIAWKFEEQIPDYLGQDFDFIVTQNQYFEGEVIDSYPSFNSHVELLDTNEKVSVWTKK